jgi:hypothetical protein
MKTLVVLFIAVFLFSCEKEKKPKPEMVLTEAYIIGFDPCIRRGSHVIVTNNYKDTLVAYLMQGGVFINRLDTIYKFPDCYEVLYSGDTIYTFPEDFNYYYREDFLFPDSVRNKYRIFVNYTLLEEDEKIPIVCQADFYPAQFRKHVRNRQIKINYATKFPIYSVKIK